MRLESFRRAKAVRREYAKRIISAEVRNRVWYEYHSWWNCRVYGCSGRAQREQICMWFYIVLHICMYIIYVSVCNKLGVRLKDRWIWWCFAYRSRTGFNKLLINLKKVLIWALLYVRVCVYIYVCACIAPYIGPQLESTRSLNLVGNAYDYEIFVCIQQKIMWGRDSDLRWTRKNINKKNMDVKK